MDELPEATPPPADHPSRSTLVNWLRANLALTTFVMGAVVGGGGGLIGFGAWTSDYRHEVKDQQRINDEFRQRLGDHHKIFVDVDRRLNEAAAARYDDRRAAETAASQINESRNRNRAELEREISDLRGGVDVLRAQLSLFVDHLPPPIIGARR